MLNESQMRRLRVSCQHIDRTLHEIESILNESASRAAFPPYLTDLSPAQRKTIGIYCPRPRRGIGVPEGQGIAFPPPDVPVSRAVRADCIPSTLRPKSETQIYAGYGEVSELLRRNSTASRGSCRGLSSTSTSSLQEPGRILRNACSGWRWQATTFPSFPVSNAW